MSSFTLNNTPFPESTSVSVYLADGYTAAPATPPGSPVTTATVSGGSLTFTGLTDHVPYFAYAEVGGVWRSRRFEPGQNGPAPRLPDGLDYADIGAGKAVVVSADGDGFEFVSVAALGDSPFELRQVPSYDGSRFVGALPQAVDICAEFGVTTADNNNAARIIEALETLGPLGLRAVISKPGNYGITEPIVIGDGTSSAVSTWTGQLEGVGNPGWLDQFNGSRVQITWRGAAGAAAMVEIQGPVAGWGLRKLLLHGNEKANVPVRNTAGQFGGMEDVYAYTTRNGFVCRPSASFGSTITNCMHNTYRRIGIAYLGLPESEKSARNAGILLTTEGATDANCCFEDWQHVWIAVPKSSVGNELSALHIGGSDSNWFRDIHPLYAAGGSDPQYSVTFDYNDGNTGWPESALIEGIDIIKNPRNVGTPTSPSGTAPNIITHISGANSGVTSDPKLQNLSWQNPRVLVADRRQGQPGLVSPTENGWAATSQVMEANVAYLSRFLPDRDIANPKLIFNVTTPATNNDKVDVAIYDSEGKRLASSGETAALANVEGLHSLTLSTTLVRGQTYYAAIAYGSVGGTAATIQCANFNAVNNGGIFGSSIPNVRTAQKTSAFPLPTTITPTAKAIGSMLGVEGS